MVRGFSTFAAAAAVSIVALAGATASAAEPPSLDLRYFRASTDPNGGLYLEPVATPGHLEWNVGAWASYANRLLTLETPARREAAVPVEHQLSVDWVAGVGLTDRLAVGVVLPSVVYQSGSELRGVLPEADALPSAALGDLAFTAKATLIPSGEIGGFALGALARVSLPTGDQTSYISESAAGGELRALAELGLVAIVLRGTAGVRVRGSEQTYAKLTFGHELPWGAGISFKPQVLGIDRAGRWQWNLEAHGSTSLTPTFASTLQSPAALALSSRVQIGHAALTVGAEAPLVDAVGAPRVRAVLGLGFAPRFPDVDEEGLDDDEDQCAELAEDKDGFEDSDGCPDFDNDGDGVPDESDKCPAEKEDGDGFEDEDGCVDPDNDHDGVLDAKDACPAEPGPASMPGAEPGCPVKDQDVDGIPDGLDKCPKQPEDRDSHEDVDGCPDPDNDADSVPDAEDACPVAPGPARSDPALHGCPSPDKDGDTFDDGADGCVDRPEDWNGNADADGCPDDAQRAAMARFEESALGLRLVLARPITFDAAGVDARSEDSVRAIAALLNGRPEAVLMVAVRPTGAGGEAEQTALNRSFAIVEALRRYTHRDDVAETIGWSAVRKLPGAAERGVGFLVLSPNRAGSKPP